MGGEKKPKNVQVIRQQGALQAIRQLGQVKNQKAAVAAITGLQLLLEFD